MTEWIGQLLASLPGWLFLPALIIFSIISIIVWWAWSVSTTAVWPFRQKRVDLGEKKR